MGEEDKKPEDKKPEEAKKPEEEKKEKKAEEKTDKPPSEEKKQEKKAEESKDSKEPPPPPPEIVLKVYMHCEGCARKVRRCLKGFEGVEDVITDTKTNKVVVKGEKADPLKVLDRVQRKSHRQVELLSPIPKPPAEDAKKIDEKEAKPEVEKEPPPVITVVLKVHMHCEACAQEIQKRIQRMKGVESAEPDLRSSEVTVKGVFDPPKLVEYVYKRTGKHAVIVKQEPVKKKEEEENAKGGKEKAAEGGDKDNKADKAAAPPVEAEAKEKKEDEETKAGGGGGGGEGETTVVDVKKSEYYYYIAPIYAKEMATYPPQIFSDENPNACSIM